MSRWSKLILLVLGGAVPLIAAGAVVLDAADLGGGDAAGASDAPRGRVRADAQEAEPESPDVVLPGPTFEGHDVPVEPIPPRDDVLPHILYLTALQFDAHVFESIGEKPRVRGVIRRGQSVQAGRRGHGPGCERGRWFRVPGGGYACTIKGFYASTKPRMRRPRPPDLSAALPYRYAEVTRGSPRFLRIPTAAEETLARSAAAGEEDWPDVVEDQLNGDYFVAIERRADVDDRSYFETLRGQFVRVEDVQVYETQPMHGERLGEDYRLPIAFVYGEDRPAYRLSDGRLEEVGIAEKHARFVVDEVFEHDGSEWVRGTSGVTVARDSVRVARTVDRPPDVSESAQWVHVDLGRQTLVAYEGDEPVYATLVSSGREGYETPRGLFHVREKYVSITMRGEDPVDGPYEVEEVPWTLYYYESYALHGAYWHDDFGNVRSHGCTNIPPPDARWLYNWSQPRVPAGWHGLRLQTGTWAYFTRTRQ